MDLRLNGVKTAETFMRRGTQRFRAGVHMIGEPVTDWELTVVLVGGPPEIAGLYQRTGCSHETPAKIVVAFYGRHQHYVATGETELVAGRHVPAFRFAYSTAIAE
jgi:hypothetical protein